MHTSFNVAFGLLTKEDEASYEWVLTQLHRAATQAGINMPQVIITDFDLALKKGLSTVFPGAQQQLCVWHIMKNVILHIKRKWQGPLEGAALMGHVAEDRHPQQLAAERAILIETQHQVRDADQDDPLAPLVESVIQNARTLSREIVENPPQRVTASEPTFEQGPDGFRESWVSVIYAHDEDTFKQRWQALTTQFKEQSTLIAYLENTSIPMAY